MRPLDHLGSFHIWKGPVEAGSGEELASPFSGLLSPVPDSPWASQTASRRDLRAGVQTWRPQPTGGEDHPGETAFLPLYLCLVLTNSSNPSPAQRTRASALGGRASRSV